MNPINTGIGENKINVIFDNKGNLYLQHATNNSEVYQVNIGKNNSLVCQLENDLKLELADFTTIDTTQFHGLYSNKIEDTDESQNDQCSDDEVESDGFNTDSDIDNDEIDEETRTTFDLSKFYPEDKSYKIADVETESSENYDVDGFLVESFNFYSSNNIYPVFSRDDETTSLYETIVFNEKKYPFFKSTLSNGVPAYRINIHNNGSLEFKPLGGKSVTYNAVVDNSGTLELVL